MTTIASLAVFFVTTRLVNISRPTPSTRHVPHPVEPWHGAGASVSVRGDNRRRVDDAEVDAIHAHRDGGTQQQSASHATRDKREQRQATARSPPQLRLGLDDGPSAQRRLPL